MQSSMVRKTIYPSPMYTQYNFKNHVEHIRNAINLMALLIVTTEAETFQQRAERRRGQEALTCYEAAAKAFQQALDAAATSSPSFSRLSDCRFGLAETLQCWAETLLEVLSRLPDNELTKEKEQESTSFAGNLFNKAVQNYQQVRDSPPIGNATDSSIDMRVDAAVNCANALSSWVAAMTESNPEMDAPSQQQASNLLSTAEEYYTSALAQEEDASTWSNLADVLIQHGELLCKGGAGTEGGEMFSRAREAYSRACGLSSSEQGDDLPGLLLNWGAGVLAAAAHAQTGETAIPLLEEAATRLRESLSFDRGDPAPHNALGETLVAMAEWFMKRGDLARATLANEAALEEGYGGGLKINASHSDALIGIAEVRAQQAKLALAIGDQTAAKAASAGAVEAYSRALAKPEALGNLSERAGVRYNYACCLVGCGRLEEAVLVLRDLLAKGYVAPNDVAQDLDLAPLLNLL